ncbi:major facilitator protein [Pseudomonas oryzihabitans]|nr:major facilitator protein [Pseudomonas psychrotolerans]KTT31835.1 major facilitator protein [Pseudomonas psychrotolerans]KTT37151.1 major facilitator protein [Pseudomonas psychrotolerans]KTT77366.1 major facilitator protein [Pseudomonas psychrotolerans]
MEARRKRSAREARRLSTTAPLADGLPRPRRQRAIAALLLAISMTVLDSGIANLALPTIAEALDVSAAAAVWIVSAYQLSLVALLFPLAAVAERQGLRPVFAAGVGIFGLASLGCALAPDLPSLVAARALQGVGAAAIMCVSAGIVRLSYPRDRLGRGIAINALCVALGSAAAPSLGAAILTLGGWPWLFAVNVPIALVIGLLVRNLPDSPRAQRRLDPLSVGLNALVFCAGIGGLERLGGAPLQGVALLLVAAVSLLLLIRRERGLPAPLLPVDLLGLPAMRHSVLASVCSFAAQMLCFLALPFYLQHQLGLVPLHVALLMLAWPLTVAVSAQVAGRLADRYPPQRLCMLGGLGIALGLAAAAGMPLARSTLLLIPCLILGGIGFGFFQVPNNRIMLTAAPAGRNGATGGVQATARQTGMALGAAALALLLHLDGSLAPRLGLALAAALGLVAAWSNWRAPR